MAKKSSFFKEWYNIFAVTHEELLIEANLITLLI